MAPRLALAARGSEAEGPVERAEIFATFRDYLERSARQAPLLVVIEDLHWSTATTRDSLRYLARLGGAAPALFVLTSRDSAPDLDDALARFLAELGRQPCVEVIRLSALTEEDVARLLAEEGSRPARRGGVRPDRRQPTVGPGGERGDRGVNSVNSLLSARFDRAASAEMELLDVAVVTGSDSAPISSPPPPATISGQCSRRSNWPKTPGSSPLIHASPCSSRSCTHCSARSATTRSERAPGFDFARGHRRRPGPRADDERVLPLLAHHACAAAPLGQAEDAAMLARSAGHLARRRHGYDEAAEQYERALAMLELVASAASRLGLLLRVDLATALLDGGRPAGRPLLQAAIEEARRRADDEALASATIALLEITAGSPYGGRVDHDMAAMFSEALDRVPAEPSRLRARLLIGLSSHVAVEDVLRSRVLARAAIDMARELGDLPAVGDGLMTYRWLIFEPAADQRARRRGRRAHRPRP